MARGDGGKVVFEDDADRKSFIFRLGQVCESHGWKVHAWVLMGNHYHLLLETPEPNLVSGMKYLMGTFSQGWNRARLRRGHVFQGRYKSVPISTEGSDPHYFRTVADYIHLNPARARLAGGKQGPLASYKWSSLKSYRSGKGPDWLVIDRVLAAFELAEDGRGRRAYVAWLEARAENNGGEVDSKAQEALRRGWYLGKVTFRDKLLAMIDNASGKPSSGRSRTGAEIREHGEMEAERLVQKACTALVLPPVPEACLALAKSDKRKILIAMLLRKRTGVSNAWIAERLGMGHPGSVSRMISSGKNNRELMREFVGFEAGINY